jgi:hypothetical protein
MGSLQIILLRCTSRSIYNVFEIFSFSLPECCIKMLILVCTYEDGFGKQFSLTYLYLSQDCVQFFHFHFPFSSLCCIHTFLWEVRKDDECCNYKQKKCKKNWTIFSSPEDLCFYFKETWESGKSNPILQIYLGGESEPFWLNPRHRRELRTSEPVSRF